MWNFILVQLFDKHNIVSRGLDWWFLSEVHILMNGLTLTLLLLKRKDNWPWSASSLWQILCIRNGKHCKKLFLRLFWSQVLYEMILLSVVTSFLNLTLKWKGFFSAQRETPYSSNLPLPLLCNSMYLSTEFSYFLWASHKFLFLPCFLFISGLSSLICFQGFNIILALVFRIFLSLLSTRLCLLRTAFWHVSLEVLFYPLKFRKE